MWRDTKRSYPRQWQQAAGDAEYLFYMTAAELEQLKDELSALLLDRFLDRLTDPSLRPADSVPVEILTLCYPTSLPPAEHDGRPATRGTK